MAEKNRKLAPATLLILLSIAAFATAAVTITNITEWSIKAVKPPIVKEEGLDCDNCAVQVTTRQENDGTNRTVITIKGFRGDIVNYTSVIKVCHRGSSYVACTGEDCSAWDNRLNVKLVYKGLLGGSQWNDYIRYIKLNIDGSSTPLIIKENTQVGAESGEVTLNAGNCVNVSAELLIDASIPDRDLCQDLTKLEIDVVATKP